MTEAAAAAAAPASCSWPVRLMLVVLAVGAMFAGNAAFAWRTSPLRPDQMQHIRCPGSAAAAATTSNTSSSSSSIRLFVGVLSAGSNFEARRAVRETWGADRRLARVVFVVLRPASNATWARVRREAQQFGDVLVVSEEPEGYYRITYAVLEIFRAAAAAGGMTHAMKTDDDCFVRVSPLLQALQRMPRRWLYAGTPMAPGSVLRGPGWHQVPYSNWASDAPVRYGFGLGYVLTSDLVQHIAAGAPHTIMRPGNLLIIEDVAVGYWVAHIAAEQNATVAYDGSMRMSVHGCTPQDVVTHITSKPKWAAMRCMHERKGQCCGSTAV